jgi:hypothetical protein
VRKLFLLFLIILLTGCIFNTSSPQWFSRKSLQHAENEIIGYARAEELNVAKQSAKCDIVEMLQVDVTSILNIETQSSMDKYKRTSNRKIKTSTTLRLNNLKILKQEKNNNIWYVAIVYDNLSLAQKIIRATNPKRENFNNPYLKETKLFKALKDKFGFYPKAKIYAQNGQYYIAIDNQQFLISQQEFIELFTNREHQKIEIKLKDRLKHNEMYFINTQFREFGFASLFLVYEKGMVVNMFKNIELVDGNFTYPNKEEYDGLRATIDGAKENRDMFVVLLCKQKEDFWQINQMSIEEEKDSFTFGDLIDLMWKCAFATKVLTIVR